MTIYEFLNFFALGRISQYGIRHGQYMFIIYDLAGMEIDNSEILSGLIELEFISIA